MEGVYEVEGMLCPIATRVRSSIASSPSGNQNDGQGALGIDGQRGFEEEIVSYKLGKKKCSYNRIVLRLTRSVLATTTTTLNKTTTTTTQKKQKKKSIDTIPESATKLNAQNSAGIDEDGGLDVTPTPARAAKKKTTTTTTPTSMSRALNDITNDAQRDIGDEGDDDDVDANNDDEDHEEDERVNVVIPLTLERALEDPTAGEEMARGEGLGFTLYLSGSKLELRCFLVYETPMEWDPDHETVLPPETPGANMQEHTKDSNKCWSWTMVTRTCCMRERRCEGPVLRAIQRFGKLGRHSTQPAAVGGLKQAKNLFVAIDEASNHVAPFMGTTRFRLLIGIFEVGGRKLLGSTVSAPIRSVANNDVPLGAATIGVDCAIPVPWKGWSALADAAAAAEAAENARRTVDEIALALASPDTPHLSSEIKTKSSPNWSSGMDLDAFATPENIPPSMHKAMRARDVHAEKRTEPKRSVLGARAQSARTKTNTASQQRSTRAKKKTKVDPMAAMNDKENIPPVADKSRKSDDAMDDILAGRAFETLCSLPPGSVVPMKDIKSEIGAAMEVFGLMRSVPKTRCSLWCGSSGVGPAMLSLLSVSLAPTAVVHGGHIEHSQCMHAMRAMCLTPLMKQWFAGSTCVASNELIASMMSGQAVAGSAIGLAATSSRPALAELSAKDVEERDSARSLAHVLLSVMRASGLASERPLDVSSSENDGDTGLVFIGAPGVQQMTYSVGVRLGMRMARNVMAMSNVDAGTSETALVAGTSTGDERDAGSLGAVTAAAAPAAAADGDDDDDGAAEEPTNASAVAAAAYAAAHARQVQIQQVMQTQMQFHMHMQQMQMFYAQMQSRMPTAAPVSLQPPPQQPPLPHLYQRGKRPSSFGSETTTTTTTSLPQPRVQQIKQTQQRYR